MGNYLARFGVGLGGVISHFTLFTDGQHGPLTPVHDAICWNTARTELPARSEWQQSAGNASKSVPQRLYAS